MESQMSIVQVKSIQTARNGRYAITTTEGVILTTPKDPTAAVAGVRGAIAAMTGPFWAAIQLDAEGHLTTIEGVEF
jgi:hypothetical protein